MRSLVARALRGPLALPLVLGVVASGLLGCGGHTERTLKMRTALDHGDANGAIRALNEELEVKSSDDLPKSVLGDEALLVLDRGSIQQSLARFAASKKDLEVADKAIDMLDLAHNAGDSIGKYVFSDSVGRYQAPPYEKLLINTLNMVNYLETKDLSGALVEARRLAVQQRYFRDSLKEGDNAILGLGALLAGFAFEKSGDVDEALRFYDDALAFGPFNAVKTGVERIYPRGTYRTKRLDGAAKPGGDGAAGAELPAPGGERAGTDDSGEILFVIGYGRVPHKIAERIPIGLALTLYAHYMPPSDRALAMDLATQGLVTWINFPTLGQGQGDYANPTCKLDSGWVELEQVVDVSHEVRAQWKKIEGQIIVSAITRMIARFAVGRGIRAASGEKSAIGLIASLAAQGTLTALDTPDTRSWETLPARVTAARVRVAPGKHTLSLEARGFHRDQVIDVAPGGWAVVSLMGLR